MSSEGGASWLGKVVARVLRLVPLVSGCGKIANRPALVAMAGGGGPVWVKSRRGALLRCYLNDYVGRALFYFGDLDPKLSWVLGKVLKPGDHFIDVGANVGLLTFLGSELVGEGGRVLAIDPQPRVLDCLDEAVVRNGVRNVEIGRYGVGEEPGRLVLHVPSGNLGGASFRHIPNREAEAVEVEVRTLAEVVRGSGFASAKLVKLDVEGVEAEVILGAQSVWRSHPPEVVIFEFREGGEARDSRAGTLLLGLGYQLYRLPRNWFTPRLVPEGELAEGTRLSHDVVAVHESAPYEVLSYFNG